MLLGDGFFAEVDFGDEVEGSLDSDCVDALPLSDEAEDEVLLVVEVLELLVIPAALRMAATIPKITRMPRHPPQPKPIFFPLLIPRWGGALL